jgi:hypothetical protein
MRSLGADSGTITVTGEYQGVGGEGAKESIIDASDNGRKVAALKGGVARTSRKEGVAGEKYGSVVEGEAN